MRHPIAEEIAVIHMDETQTRVQGIRYPVRPRNLLHRSRHHEQFHNRLMSLFTKITHCRHFREGGGTEYINHNKNVRSSRRIPWNTIDYPSGL